ncbi:MAG: isoprenylcysteine carboxylmethyltransferase family protein [Bacteroidota bacterium]
MDPINFILAIILFVSISANWGGAKKGLKTSITKVIEKPKSFLQKSPPTVSALILIMIILGIFGIGTVSINNNNQFQIIRIIGLICFALFSWLQIVAYRSLGDSYAPDIVVLKNHKLQTRGVYRFIRHPQYLGQLLSDLSAGIALMSFVVVPMVLLLELPLFIIRAYEEEKILTNYFKDEYKSYKKKSGFFLPFVG